MLRDSLNGSTDELGDVVHGDEELRLDDGELPGDLGQHPPPPGELLHQATRLTQAQSWPHWSLLPFSGPRHVGHVTNRLKKKIKCRSLCKFYVCLSP